MDKETDIERESCVTAALKNLFMAQSNTQSTDAHKRKHTLIAADQCHCNTHAVNRPASLALCIIPLSKTTKANTVKAARSGDLVEE